MKAGELVLVDWVDSNGAGPWELRGSAIRDAREDSLRCQTVGWVLDDDDRYLLVAASQTVDRPAGEDQVADWMQIPKVAITSVRRLQIGRASR